MGLFSRRREVSVELGPEIFEALYDVMSDTTGMTRHKNISFGGIEIKQWLNIVGESQFQETIAKFSKGWSYGFLVPEQDNPFDKNAVVLYLIDDSYEIHKVGYLRKDVAAKVSQPIANLLASEGRLIPALCKVEGGTKEKPNFGVFAWTRSNEITFPD